MIVLTVVYTSCATFYIYVDESEFSCNDVHKFPSSQPHDFPSLLKAWIQPYLTRYSASLVAHAVASSPSYHGQIWQDHII